MLLNSQRSAVLLTNIPTNVPFPKFCEGTNLKTRAIGNLARINRDTATSWERAKLQEVVDRWVLDLETEAKSAVLGTE